jgi:hypothetical protein
VRFCSDNWEREPGIIGEREASEEKRTKEEGPPFSPPVVER